jgi:hypothetical protein
VLVSEGELDSEEEPEGVPVSEDVGVAEAVAEALPLSLGTKEVLAVEESKGLTSDIAPLWLALGVPLSVPEMDGVALPVVVREGVREAEGETLAVCVAEAVGFPE